jgi:glycerophosphoryl diester phosphodiesterase
VPALVIGHRGASGYRPEHTRAAYELAFALGADAVEPDIVATRDGVLVIRHENEISGTTDVAAHPEFADRRTSKHVDGVERTGWFTEDFTWGELSTLRARERLPRLRRGSSGFDGLFPVMRLSELFDLVDACGRERGHPLALVAEIKHATYFDSLGLPLDELFARAVNDAGWNDPDRLTVESFERTVLERVRARGILGRSVYLLEDHGAPFDAVARDGAAARSYADDLGVDGHGVDGRGVDGHGADGLAALAAGVGDAHLDGISVSMTMLVHGAAREVDTDLIERAHGAGLELFCWTLRPENRYLAKGFRGDGGAAAWGDWRGEYRALFEAGVDAVFADHPDLAVVARADAQAGPESEAGPESGAGRR